MNNKMQTIDEFLKFFRDIMIENPNKIDDITHYTSIYSNLIRLGVNETDKNSNLSRKRWNKENKKLESIFDAWIDNFASNPKIRVFVDPSWKYFCQFTSRQNIQNAPEHLKLYIPVNASHIEKSANLLFDFLSENEIPHRSKIGKQIRFDDIVIRLVSPNDVEKVKQFVSSNNYIKEGMMTPNPFAFSENGIVFACDGDISYNGTVAKYISLYLKDCYNKNNLNKVGVEDFYQFIFNYYNKTFITKEKLENIFDDFDFTQSYEFKKVADYKCVTELILKASNPSFTYEDYINHYHTCAQYGYKEQIIQELKTYLFTVKNQEKERKEEILTINISKEELEITEDLLLLAVNTMTQKYGKPFALNNIEGYLKEENEDYLTRTNEVRDKITNSNFKENLQTILNDNNLDLETYINIVFDKQKQKEKRKKENFLKEAIIQTYNKYGKADPHEGLSFATGALKELIGNDNYKGFTRDYDARINLINNVKPNEARNIITEELNLGDIEISFLSNQQLKEVSNIYVSKIINNEKEKNKKDNPNAL